MSEYDVPAGRCLCGSISFTVTGPLRGVDARYVTAVGSSDYASAFGKLLADPFSAHLRWTAKEHEAVLR